MNIYKILGKKIVFSGGGFFRFYPYKFIKELSLWTIIIFKDNLFLLYLLVILLNKIYKSEQLNSIDCFF